jgi:class 3 adenylate cyclase
VLISQRLHAAVDEHVEAEPLSEALTLKGFSRPVSVFRVRELREPSG